MPFYSTMVELRRIVFQLRFRLGYGMCANCFTCSRCMQGELMNAYALGGQRSRNPTEGRRHLLPNRKR